jgi:cation transport ATPase
VTAPALAPAVTAGTREIELSIEGMTCAACAARMENKLNKLPGVIAAVNYATATALVTAPAGLPAVDLTAVVEQAGYAARERVREQVARGGDGEPDAARHVAVLDKTGTVTTGQMSLAGVQPAEDVSRTDLLRYAGAVEQASEHAVAAASAAAATDEAGPLPQAGEFRALPGLGARGIVDDREVVVGREKLSGDWPNRLQAQLRCAGERGNARLKYWKVLATELRCRPSECTAMVKAVLALHYLEHDPFAALKAA